MSNGNVYEQLESFIHNLPDENRDKTYTMVVKFQGKKREMDGLQFTFSQEPRQVMAGRSGKLMAA